MESCPTAADYTNSLARVYIMNKHAAYAAMNFMELDDIDFTKLLVNTAASTQHKV